MPESIEEIAKKDDLKNAYKKCFRSFHTLAGSRPTSTNCSKLIEEPKELPDSPGKEDKGSSSHLH